MDLILKHKIKIDNPTKELLDWCKQNLEFDNPDYIKKEAMGKWTGNTRRKIVLYEKEGNTLYLPFGVFADIYKRFKNKFHKAECYIAALRGRNYKSSINLYDYQENAVKSVIQAKNGILVAPCGSGKTQMGLEIVARLGIKALWVTHTIDLLNQSMSRAQANFGLPLTEYGTITAGRVNIGNTITFATVQTLSNIDLSQYTDCWDMIIVDECHKCVGSPTQMMMFYKVLSQLSARYKVGLTATPYRADGLEKSMFALLGGIIHEVPKSAVKDKTCPVVVQFVNTNYTPDLDLVLAGDGTIIYSNLIKDLCKDTKRNLIIASEIMMKNGAMLVLSDRVEHLEVLFQKVKDFKRCVMLKASNTKAEKENRKKVLQMLNNGEIDVVFATYKLAKEGLDVPNLRYVIFATPQKDKTTVIQSAGRVARKYAGKAHGTIIDYVDDFGMLKGYYRKRKGYYKKLGYEIIDI